MLFQKILTKSVVCFMKKDQPIGSGVILHFGNDPFICTCKHIVEAAPDSFMVDNKSLTKNKFTINLKYFRCHKDADIALIPLHTENVSRADSDIIALPESESLLYNSKEFNDLSLGDTVFALGFPLGLVGENKNYPILKGGFIARLDSECIEQGKHFLIDSNIFPGNSGGPVFLKPEIYGIGETNPIQHGYLLGIVSGYIPYVDELISKQTGRIVSTNVEHSGLSKIVPIHYAKEIYDEHRPKTISN